MTQPLFKFKPFEVTTVKTTNKNSYSKYDPYVEKQIVCNDDFMIIYEYEGIFWKYQFGSCKWTRMECQNLPVKLVRMSMLLMGRHLVIHGCIDFASGYITLIGDVSKPKIEFQTIGFLNVAPNDSFFRVEQPIVTDGKYFYVVGASRIGREINVYKLDPHTKSWNLMYGSLKQNENNFEHLNHRVTYYNRCFYVFDSVLVQKGNWFFPLDTFKNISVFNTLTNKWKFSQTLSDPKSALGYPYQRVSYGLTQNDKYLYVSGGHLNVTYFQDVWRLDLVTLKWCWLAVCNQFSPTDLHATAITPSGCLYFYQHKNVQKNMLQKTWVKIPMFKDICLNAVLFYFKDKILEATVEDLVDMGLPSNVYNKIKGLV